MRQCEMAKKVGRCVFAGTVLGLCLAGLGGCASEPSKPAPPVAPDQVRGHADKAFEKLKQEEQTRQADPGTSR